MTLQDFRELIEAYGANPSRWPEDRRDAADAFLAGSSEAQAFVADAAELDQMLARVEEPDVSDAFLASVMSVPAHEKQDRRMRQKGEKASSPLSLRFLFPRLAGVAATAVIVGFVMGSANLVPTVDLLNTPVTDDEITDLSDMVFLDYDDEEALL